MMIEVNETEYRRYINFYSLKCKEKSDSHEEYVNDTGQKCAMSSSDVWMKHFFITPMDKNTITDYPLLLWSVVLISFFVMLFLFSSCSGSRHMVKSETKSDSTAIVKTETKKDSIVNTSTVTKTETEVNNYIQSEDNYTEKTTETTKYDKETGKPIESTKTKERTGTRKEKDLTKTNTKTDVKNTTASNFTEIKKENNKTTVKKGKKKKAADTDIGLLSKGNVIACIVLLVLIVSVIVAWPYLKKRFFTKPKIEEKMDGDS